MKPELLKIVKEVEEQLDFKCTKEELYDLEMTATISMIAGLSVDKVVKDAVVILGLMKKRPDIPTYYSFIFTN